MEYRISCKTVFDITETKIRTYYREALMPVVDATGATITTSAQWQLVRNQQRNWDTINQIISLRCLPESITSPVVQYTDNKKIWYFEFVLESLASIATDTDHTAYLKTDATGVPMITNLLETPGSANLLNCTGPCANCWFDVVGHK